jgi:uncharacterized protein YdeI (YjbR/CyaY-like superfamily)
MADVVESFHPLSRAEWRAWLATNHTRTNGIWVISYKKSTGKPAMSYDDGVEEAICFGWIDSKVGKVDGERSKLWYAPRKPGTGWSRPNKLRVEKLAKLAVMHPAGQAKIDAAKADGSWSKLDAVEELVVPADLAKAFRAHAGAKKNWDAFPRSAKRGILEWIQLAKKPETRANRVNETARLAQKNERANQWKPK